MRSSCSSAGEWGAAHRRKRAPGEHRNGHRTLPSGAFQAPDQYRCPHSPSRPAARNWASRAGIKLGLGIEQSGSAAHTSIQPIGMVIVVRAGEACSVPLWRVTSNCSASTGFSTLPRISRSSLVRRRRSYVLMHQIRQSVRCASPVSPVRAAHEAPAAPKPPSPSRRKRRRPNSS